MIIIIVIGCDLFSKQLAEKLNVPMANIEKRYFPDKELCPRILTEIKDDHVILVNRMEFPVLDPNAYLVESLLLIKTLKEMGKKIEFVMPYMIYGRQDKQFREGEPVSARSILDILADAGASNILTVSSHYERTKDILSAKISVYNINGFEAFLEKIREIKNPIITGADFGVSENVDFISCALKVDSIVFEKHRSLDTGSIEMNGLIEAKGRNVVIIDDIISSGGTIIKAINICKNSGAKSVSVFVIHNLAKQETLDKIDKMAFFYATDTIETPKSEISVVDIVAKRIQSL